MSGSISRKTPSCTFLNECPAWWTSSLQPPVKVEPERLQVGGAGLQRFFHPGRFCGTKTKLTMNSNLIMVWCTVAAQLHGGIAVTLKRNQSRELVNGKAMTRFFA
jgi:hypothetical protein